MRDGKLITLTNHVALPPSQTAQPPLNRLPFYFPVPPIGELRRTASASHSEKAVVRRGTVSQFGGPELEEFSWSSEFLVPAWHENTGLGDPYRYFPSYAIRPPAGFKHYGANEAYSLLREIMQQGLVVVLNIEDRNTGELEVQMPVTIRNIEMSEEGGEPDTRSYSITLRQYRFLTIRTVPRGGSVPSGGTPRPSGTRFIPSPYKVKKEMGIQELALLAYRDRSKWGLIVKAQGGSKGMFGKGCRWRPDRRDGPYLIPKGTILSIPLLTNGWATTIGFVKPGTPPPTGL